MRSRRKFKTKIRHERRRTTCRSELSTASKETIAVHISTRARVSSSTITVPSSRACLRLSDETRWKLGQSITFSVIGRRVADNQSCLRCSNAYNMCPSNVMNAAVAAAALTRRSTARLATSNATMNECWSLATRTHCKASSVPGARTVR